MKNIFSSLPEDLSAEVFEDIVSSESVRIERIVSKGHTSPESGWYDQEESEWVIVLQGAARLLFDDGREESLDTGDFINIPAHIKHKVSWTDPYSTTIWLAVFYK
ncbi:cupin domain-containing protein [Microbulbifer rhizosphaerae]|uniref:Cupin 2 domain-containing protein n=1 Tax=Microbulbifer rhizosphaerae TaxID=1562603 RepID=A0A7W4WFM5_9GAMM|nr:cupin domain-containing protein [Microbulbifer rhizosphaerae]MBB3063317.1 cupin 2 domain-containing protein [Microbulbifer rhizosphaerae]